MKIKSTNRAEAKRVLYQGKSIKTGIFKYPHEEPIFLGLEAVKGDCIADREVHGGVDKACYLYSTEHYPFWKKRYPHLVWNYGMFGENLTVEALQESQMYVGDVYQIGEALAQVVEPRQPCYKLGIRFNDQGVLKQFISTTYSGLYLKIFEEGFVQTGDMIKLKAKGAPLSIADVFKLLYHRDIKQSHFELAMANEILSDECKSIIYSRWSRAKGL